MSPELIENLLLIGLVIVWVALPLLPSVLIYSLFPDSTMGLTGPLSGLTIRASGAFAAYLIIFLILIPFVNSEKDTIRDIDLHEYWTVTGKLALKTRDGQPYTSEILLKDASVSMSPSEFEMGHYKITVRLLKREEKLEDVTIHIPNFGDGYLDGSEIANAANKSYLHRTIQLSEPIIIVQNQPENLRDIPVVSGDRASSHESRDERDQ